MSQLEINLFATELTLSAGSWQGDSADLSQSMSVPALMVAQALESMKEAKKIGQKLKDEETKQIILAVLNAAFLLIPFAGEGAAALTGITTIAKAGGLVSIAGNTGMGIYDAAEHPEMAPLAILGILLGAKGLTGTGDRAATVGEEDVTKMTALRAQMSTKMTKGMGPSFEKNSAVIDRIGSICYARKG